MVLRITEQGEELVRRLLPLLFAPLREMFEDLSDAEQQQLIAQLKRLGVKLEDLVPAQPRGAPLVRGRGRAALASCALAWMLASGLRRVAAEAEAGDAAAAKRR